MSKKYNLRIIALVLISVLVTGYKEESPRILWGINGHPLTQGDYSYRTWDDQFFFIKDMELDTYRFDVLLKPDGTAKKDESLISLFKKLKSHNISPFPVIQTGINTKDSIEIYKISYQQGKNFAKRYGDFIQEIEVGNEEDNKIILSPHVDGTKESHYDLVKTDRIMAKLKGFIDGVKFIKPSVRVSLSVCWVHFYYLEFLKKYNVNYDIIGYHWYSDMGDITRVRPPYGNVLNKVYTRYGKPIWITEFNYFKGTTKVSYEKQDTYITKTLNNIIPTGQVERFYIYELFDQPSLKIRYPGEASYGLLAEDQSGTGYIKKDAYLSYRRIIKNYKNGNK